MALSGRCSCATGNALSSPVGEVTASEDEDDEEAEDEEDVDKKEDEEDVEPVFVA